MTTVRPIEEGTLLDVEGERYRVIGITDLGMSGLTVPGVRHWGTHILTLRRHSDGRHFAATLYESGKIDPPHPFHREA